MYSHGVVDPMPRHPGALNPEGPITLCTRLAAEALCSRTASCAIPSGSRAARACPRTARPRKSAVQAERRRAGAPRPRVTCRGSWRAQPARARPPAPRAPAARPAAGRRRPAGGPGAARAPRARARSAARPPGAHAAGARSAGARRSEEEGAPECSLLLGRRVQRVPAGFVWASYGWGHCCSATWLSGAATPERPTRGSNGRRTHTWGRPLPGHHAQCLRPLAGLG